MDKSKIISSAAFNRKVAAQLIALAEDKESYAATIPRGRHTLRTTRSIAKMIEGWCNSRHQITVDIAADNEALQCEPDNGTSPDSSTQ